MENNQKPKPKLGMLSVFKSVLAAGFGVQKEANRKKDFEQGSPMQFIVAGVAATILFLLILYGIVQWILASAQ